jgi:peptide/nickel transport system substrate-binding protein
LSWWEVISLRDKTLRSIGAGAVLFGIVIAAVVQAQGDTGPEGVDIAVETPVLSSSSAAQLDSTTTSMPFEYRIGLLSEATTNNQWRFIGEQPTAWNTYILGPTKPALYGIDPATGGLTADLALGPPVTPTFDADGWRVRVPLAEDRSWSDGTPITAADVVFTFHLTRRLKLGGGWAKAFPEQIADMYADGPYLLRIEFSGRPSLQVWPYGTGLGPIMSSGYWSPLTGSIDAAALYALDGSDDPSGGDLSLVPGAEAERDAIRRSSTPPPGPDRVVYRTYESEDEAVTALDSGEIDTILSPNGLGSSAAQTLANSTDVTLETSPSNSVRYLGFNLRREPMSAIEFRQAVALLLDKESINADLVPGADTAYTVISPSNHVWYDEGLASDVERYREGDIAVRLDQALNLLRAAGYGWVSEPEVTNGVITPGTGLTVNGRAPAPLTILTPGDEYDPVRSDYARAIEATIETFGFDVRTVVTDFDSVVDLAFTSTEDGGRQFDMYVLGWTLGNPALPDFYDRLFGDDGSANSTGYDDGVFDAALGRYQNATDFATAKTALWEMEQRLAQTLPYLVLYHPPILEAYRNDRVAYELHGVLGGIQGRAGAVGDVVPAG